MKQIALNLPKLNHIGSAIRAENPVRHSNKLTEFRKNNEHLIRLKLQTQESNKSMAAKYG